MEIILILAVLGISYLVGSIPFGLIIVRLRTGKDIRTIESGRTGGTNAMRAAGAWAGIFTAVFDFFKSFGCVYLARTVLPGNAWLEVLAPVLAILGHNYSIFLIERNPQGKVRLRGGAGGAPAAGGAAGLWFPTLFFILPIGILIFYFVGYASLGTLSVPVVSMIVFAYLAYVGKAPWQWIVYGILSGFLLAWALRPNIRRLISGNERLVGYRARRKKSEVKPPADPEQL